MENNHETSSTENIIDTLKKLKGGLSDIDHKKNKKNGTICRLLNIQLREFYDDIYIPYDFFRKDNWKINKILYNNEDILFFNKKYLTKEDEDRFHEVFDKYIFMLEEIFSQDNKLYIFLEKWTDMSQPRWKTNKNKSYLKSLLTHKKYQNISPAYTASVYCDFSKKYSDDVDKIKKKTEEHLDEITNKLKKEVREFRKCYNEIVSSYVYEYPNNTDDNHIHVLAFINSIILSILNFTEKIIQLNIYAVHPIVTHIIEYYTPLDFINQYKPSENNYRKLCIV